jgi:CDP-diacylglycerol--glycerol-3-phosphate 3-phosphatidyltransferase
MDRYSELLVYLGIAAYYVQAGRVEWIAVFLAFSGSMMVSYTRARAEGLGTDCRVGWVQRPERLAVLIVASLLGVWVTGWVLWALAVLTHLTSAQRIHHVYVVMNRPELRS